MQSELELRKPVNTLEGQEDVDGRWRRYVNAQLAGEYSRLFGQIDRLVFLKIPDFDSIFRWRLRQEAENAQQAGAAAHRVMGPESLRRFIQHYERLTRHALRVLPARADVVLELGPEHEIRNQSV
jgi:D-glycerate 3-kinase